MSVPLLCGMQTARACSRDLETSTMSMGESVRVEPGSAGEWVVEVRREWEGHAGLGRAVVRAASTPAPAQELHVKLAGDRAWMSVGQERLAAGDAQAAIACARRGLEELGPDYAPLTAGDDTVLKLAAAADELAARRREGFARDHLSRVYAFAFPTERPGLAPVDDGRHGGFLFDVRGDRQPGHPDRQTDRSLP